MLDNGEVVVGEYYGENNNDSSDGKRRMRMRKRKKEESTSKGMGTILKQNTICKKWPSHPPLTCRQSRSTGRVGFVDDGCRSSLACLPCHLNLVQ